MYRTHTCGELRIENIGHEIILAGWVQRIRDLGAMSFIDLRDRYGITQLVVDENTDESIVSKLKELGREFVVQAKGVVRERLSKNKNMPTGEIEIALSEIKILGPSKLPPFTIQDDTDGGDELRMKYRYLDLRRNVVRENLVLRAKMAHSVRTYLNSKDFIETETPVLIKSTPEGARDFVVPSRMNTGEFYALPQSPQVFKQLLMIAGFDRYYQIVKCFRDEDLRADRQPEFTQIDCEMSFVEQKDVLETFEGLTKYMFKKVLNIEVEDFPWMPYSEAMEKYGSDKPDTRFEMLLNDISEVAKGKGFGVFDKAEYVGAICADECSCYTRKQLDQLTDWVKRPQIGAKGLVYVKCNEDGSFKSSVDKFYSQEDLKQWAEAVGAKPHDLILVMSGDKEKTLSALGELRLEMGNQLKLRKKNVFKPLWVVDFPLLEWNEENNRFHAMHHPFTSPKPEDIALLETDPGKVRANAYDLVINGVEIGGGSVRIFNSELQAKMFDKLGFTPEQAQAQFGFLMNAFKYGAPPHAGIAFGFDRLVSLFAGLETIRDIIAFPKNNSGRDVMIDSPSDISNEQLEELNLKLDLKENK
ncbi:MAG: aspartate--tRNA ligase [Prolixibacteraceae bacterium]|jgi:aspartyl-tRNA synthetase|nr:aspartate--tRNA ligase [Prolixibacteraceae bacterium]MBT6763967.1 aspartate--tRNA ligase [Prolixibacteraceae bacterium]MBT6999998.1 aspartate--tRNA ligase [Prolixibacteraceae bacterium]MBT7395474.1 aspartate--tRNA ligase [Prolixibacteraceae bacterium]